MKCTSYFNGASQHSAGRGHLVFQGADNYTDIQAADSWLDEV